MAVNDGYSYTWNPNTISTTTGTVGWPWYIQTAPAPQKMQTGWQCGDCGTVMAPWKASHRCTEPDEITTDAAGLGGTFLAKDDDSSEDGEAPPG